MIDRIKYILEELRKDWAASLIVVLFISLLGVWIVCVVLATVFLVQ